MATATARDSASASLDDIAIRTVDLRVDYGEFRAVKGLDLEIPAGEIYGLVGPNGAGKTSTFKVLATLMRPTYGDVYIGGIDIAERAHKARYLMGYMPDLAPVPTDIKVWEFLDMFAVAHGVRRGQERKNRLEECLAAVNLQDKRDEICSSLSRGMKQRLVLAKNLLHRPRILILDEPASGMDPISRANLRETLRGLAADGSTVIVSSHILSELSDMCTSVGIMARGELVDTGKIDEVVKNLGRAERTLTLRLIDRAEAARDFLGRQSHVSDVQIVEGGLSFVFDGDESDQVALLKALVNQEFPVRSLEEKVSNIEEIILGLADQDEDNPENQSWSRV